MNETQNRTAAEVPSELKEQLFTAVGRVISDPEWMDSMIPDVDVVEAILDALAAAGYTIAGPGQVIVDRERWERVLYTAREGLACINHRDRLSELVPFQGVHLRRGDLDPLPTQEGE